MTPERRRLLWNVLLLAGVVFWANRPWVVLEPWETREVLIPGPTVTAWANATTMVTRTVPFTSSPGTPASNGPPVVDVVVEPPRSKLGEDFSVRLRVSMTPLQATPWQGSLGPTILLTYEAAPGRSWNATGILHYGVAQEVLGSGVTLCARDSLLYPNWTHAPETPTHKESYSAPPIPRHVEDALDDGDSCLLRANVRSQWRVQASLELDGQLSATHVEEFEDDAGRVIRAVKHVDGWDYWLSSWVTWDPP